VLGGVLHDQVAGQRQHRPECGPEHQPLSHQLRIAHPGPFLQISTYAERTLSRGCQDDDADLEIGSYSPPTCASRSAMAVSSAFIASGRSLPGALTGVRLLTRR